MKNNPSEIPENWQRLKAGGNAIVWADGNIAIKRLKRGASKESVARFKLEANIARTFQGKADLRIVRVHEVRDRAGATEIIMEKLDGSLDDVLHTYKGNPQLAARELIPIVKTLRDLAKNSPPLHHRDLKPANILYSGFGEDRRLYLADFGCAHFLGDDRITAPNRAVGAWAYRAPEYSAGRVEKVSEKGDVYSLGKIFWSMINGERGEVFPYTLWHLEEYDLSRIFSAGKGLSHTMLIVAGTVSSRPENRPTLEQLLKSMETLSVNSNDTPKSFGKDIDLLRAEAQIEIEFEQRKAQTAQFVTGMYNDFHTAIKNMYNAVPKSGIFSSWIDEAKRTPQNENSLVEQVAIQESDAPLLNVFYRRIELISRFHPALPSQPAKLTISVTDRNVGIGSAFTVFADSRGLLAEWNHPGYESKKSEPYETNTIRSFLEEAIRGITERY